MDYGHIPWQSSWFGVKLPGDFISANSTVLMTGDQSLSFLIPYFPRGVTFIRTQGNINEPKSPIFLETPAYMRLVDSRVAKEKQHGSSFYALETADVADEVDLGMATIEQYHFKM